MVTGRTSLREPEYSPISSGVRLVRRTSSSRHCRALTVLVTRISVVVPDRAIAPAPTSVLPAPQGSTTTPLPPCQKRSEEHTSELQSRGHLVCRLLLEKKKTT